MSVTICPICETEFIGRSNKKYCSDRCRSLHNTRLYMERNVELFGQEKLRKHNAKSLKTIYAVRGEEAFGRDTLERLGFHFQIGTFAAEQFALDYGSFRLIRLDEHRFCIQKIA